MEFENLDKISLLDANHPLMKRFQDAFKTHLLKQLDAVNAEMKQNEQKLKAQNKERAGIGEHMYRMQQELIKQQDKMKKLQDQYIEKVKNRCDQSSWLQVEENYKQVLDRWNQELKKDAEIQEEIDFISNKFIHLLAVETESYSEAALKKLVAKQAKKAQNDLRSENAKQNTCISGLLYEMERVQGKITFYRDQCVTQEDESKEISRELAEAKAEMEMAVMEKQKILQQWRNSLIALEKRNGFGVTLQDAYRNEKAKLVSTKTEINGLRRSLKGQLESNERLIEMVNRQKLEVGNVMKLMEENLLQKEVLERDHGMFEEMVLKSQIDLKELKREMAADERSFKSLLKEMDSVQEQNNTLDDEITKTLTEKSTLSKVTQNRKEKLIKIKRENQTKKFELNNMDNKISQLTMDIEKATSEVNLLKEIRGTQDREIQKKEDALARLQMDIEKRYKDVDNKQNMILQMRNKLTELINVAGGEEFDPLEREIKMTREECDQMDWDCSRLQKEWLALQSELIGVRNAVTLESSELEKMDRESIVLEAKQHRMEKKLEMEQKGAQRVEQELQKIKNQIDLQNALLQKEKGLQEVLEQQTEIQKLDLVGILKETEIQCVQKEEKLENIRQEAKSIQKMQQMTEEEMSLWEKKVKLLEETKKALNSALFSSEIHTLKTDIHLQEVHLNRLKKEEELVIKKMENALTLRDTLITKVDIVTQQGSKKADAKINLQNRINSLEKKLKTLKKDLVTCEQRQTDLEKEEAETRIANDEEIQRLHSLDVEIQSQQQMIQSLERNKHKNMMLLSLKQQKSKYYSLLKENRYSMKVKNKSLALNDELNKVQEEIFKSSEICEKIATEFPQHAEVFLRMAACKDCMKEL